VRLPEFGRPDDVREDDRHELSLLGHAVSL
jgi:hypothetical protein